MSPLAERTRPLVPLNNPHNVLILDIERLPGRARIKHRGLTIEGDFWDLSGWKHTIGYRIHPDDVLEWPRTICAAWNWYGKDKVEFSAEWSKSGRDGLLRKTWEAFDKAQIVVGHNIQSFDAKKLRLEWAEAGLNPPSPVKYVDTLKVARREFGAESNTLDALCRRFNLVAKTDRYSVQMARDAVNGVRSAQKQIGGYNCGDIAASKGIYDFCRPWDASHPHSVISLSDDRPTCNSCWGDDVEPNGYKLANLILYKLYRCRGCGANVQGSRHARAAVTRGAR
jgi:hypothetical protein